MSIRHAKARGEWAELRFMTRAAELGLRITKPWGDNAPYDFIVDSRGRLLRVQVKCTGQKRWNSYRCVIAANGVPYRPDQIDFIAALIIPADNWYILPIKSIPNQPEILLSPHSEKSKHAKYKEAWHLLNG
jgi:PD-(D/E)XK endonuclease